MAQLPAASRLARALPVVAAAAAALPSPAGAAEVLSTTVESDRAVQRTCHARLAPSAAGTAQRTITSPSNGLIRVRLTGDASGDWDLGVFDAATKRSVAGSAHFASIELAEGVVGAGQELVVQACRLDGPATTATVTAEAVPLAPPTGETIRVVRVETPDYAARDALAATGLDPTEHARPGYQDVVTYGADDEAVLRASGLDFRVVVPDLVAADRGALNIPSAQPMPSGRVDYRHLPDYSSDMKKLVAENPDLVKPITLRLPSLEGRPVEGIEVTRDVGAQDGKPVFLQLGIHHAREWPSSEHVIEWAFELVNGVKKQDARVLGLLEKSRLIAVPIINPDGFNLSREALVEAGQAIVDPGFAYKRRNCRVKDGLIPAPNECGQSANRNRGVDPNRNYGGLWGGPGASTSPTNDTYRGVGPFSEPETQNVQDLVSRHQVTVLITNHTYSDLILRPPGARSQPLPPDEPLYKQLGDAMARENGYSSQHGWQLYDTTGTTEDWSYTATGGLGYTFEIGKGEGAALAGAGFHPAYPIGVVAEWYGKRPPGGGNRAAYYLAMEAAANPAHHSVLEGNAPPGSVIRLHKSFQTPTSNPEITIPDVLDTVLTVPASGSFEYHANPSTRPVAAGPEAWTLSCERPDGTVLARQGVVVARGERKSLGAVCVERSGPVAATAPGTAATRLSLALAARRARLRRALARGLAVRASCSARCDLRLRLVVPARTARRLGLTRGRRAVTVGRLSVRGVDGHRGLTLKISRKAARKLRRSRRVSLTLRATATSAGGGRASLTRRITLRR